jgi:FkbM family methyltransferase
VTLKNLLITRPGEFLSENMYVKYLEVLSQVYFLLNRSIKSIQIRRYSISEASLGAVAIWNISNSTFDIITPSGFRSSRFLKGFTHAANRQWERYGIEKLLEGSKPEAVFDVGANIGEFTFAVQQRGVKNIYSFEPDPVAFKCLSYNLQGESAKLFNFALGEKTGKATFFSASEGADSSLIKPDAESRPIVIPIYRFEDFAATQAVRGGMLVKMDAEGAEPEVLRGFGKYADAISWITIDVGPERQGQSTKVEVEALLHEYGFKTSSYSEWILHGRR